MAKLPTTGESDDSRGPMGWQMKKLSSSNRNLVHLQIKPRLINTRGL